MVDVLNPCSRHRRSHSDIEGLKLKQKGLVEIIDGKSRVSEILDRKKTDSGYDSGIGADTTNISFDLITNDQLAEDRK